MFLRPEQPEKTPASRLVTPAGIVKLPRPVQFEKASAPIDVTESGTVMLLRPEQPENAPLPIQVTLPSSGVTLLLQPAISFFLSVSIRQFPAER